MADRTHTCSHCGATQLREEWIAYVNRALAEVVEDLEQGRWDIYDLPNDLRTRLLDFLKGQS